MGAPQLRGWHSCLHLRTACLLLMCLWIVYLRGLSSSEYTVSHDLMVSTQWIGKVFREVVVVVASFRVWRCCLRGGTVKNRTVAVKIASSWGEVFKRNLQRKKKNCWPLSYVFRIPAQRSTFRNVYCGSHIYLSSDFSNKMLWVVRLS